MRYSLRISTVQGKSVDGGKTLHAKDLFLYLLQSAAIDKVITLLVFVPFTVLYMKESLKWDYLWAGLCILGAVFFIFRERWAE